MSITNVSRRSAIKIGAGAMALAAGATMMSSSAGTARADEVGEVVFSAPGTYTAEGPGRYGPVTVTMTASDSAIELIDISSDETVLIGGYAMDCLKDQVLEFQSPAFDIVSGATFSSVAFRQALTDCIEQAGGDTSKLNNEIIITPNDYDTSSDVLVIGAGGAGLAAALTAAQAGASVIVIEKSPLFGGNTNAAHSGLNVVYCQTLEDLGGSASVEDFIAKQTNDYADPVLVERFAEVSGPAADWLASVGVPFTLGSRNQSQLEAEQPGSKTGVTIMRTLLERLGELDNVQLYLNTPATSLVIDEMGTVTGAVATGDAGQELTFTAGSVILATGGYGQNHEFVVECRPDYENAITDEIAPTTGDGLFMAEDIGCGTVDLDQIMLQDPISPTYGMIVPSGQGGWSAPGGPVGIYVNKQAERFGAEGSLEKADILAQEDGTVYQIFPAENADDTVKFMIAVNCAWEEDSPEALAEDMSLDPATLANTIETWNEGAADGVDNEYGRTDSGVVPLEGSITSFCFCLGVHYCMGGIAFDVDCHVLDTDGNVIPGLYACGECTGGVHGDERVDGSAVCESFAFGHVAGQTAAEDALA